MSQSAPQSQPQAVTLDTVAPESSMSILDEIVEVGKLARDPSSREFARDLVSELVEQVLDKRLVVDKTLEATLVKRIAELDSVISAQLSDIMHAPEFQKLEGSWRGFHHLVHNTETSTQLKLRVLNVTKQELSKDLEKAAEFDQSQLFKKVYESEYGTFGGAPFGLLLGDYAFDNSPMDVGMLEKLSGVAASAHAPFVTGVSPQLFRLERFTELEAPRDLEKIFTGPEYVAWNAFRDSEDSRFVSFVLPRFLSRLPYGRRTKPVEAFDFEEEVDGRTHDHYLWSNAAWVHATCITQSFAQYGWCTAIRGVEGGGLVEGLPTHTFTTDEGEVAAKVPTEVAITDRRDGELGKLGFISLVHRKGDNTAAFFSGQTANRPKKYIEHDASGNAELSARLPYLMATSRIAHYLKSIVRDKIGSFQTKETMQKYLETWIAQYVLLDDNASPAQKAKRPLREAKIAVEDVPGQPGVYRAVAHLRPHFQLEAMNISLRLVAQLPKSAK